MQIPEATIDELFSVSLIDRPRKVKITIELRDKDGDTVPLRETIEKLTEYVTDKATADGENVTKQQVLPLMAQAMCGGLVKLLGQEMSVVMLSQESTRFSLMYMMAVGFYLMKWLQKHEVKIYTTEESITDEEMDMYDRISVAQDAAVQYSMLGGSPKDLLQEMLRQGKLTPEDMETMGFKDVRTEKKEVN